ncbi:hypothetical protein L1987_54070 [Smallanthus sonchifolius]|uniref:Uncharacterized protein n=1 Tax=Smallanthus sonchifolius TaxID=185202 RepID=A0ACB9E5S5_9ASTR|nr:hypothetical protein L1987_54070 [Smallanthus sonchifolius]
MREGRESGERERGERAWERRGRRFKGVRNIDDLVRDMKSLNLGGNKLIVNLARYANENADAFLTKERPGTGRGGQVLDEDTIEVDPSVNTMSVVVGRAVVARAVDFQVLRKLNVILREAGFQGVGIQYIGGFSVILTLKDEEAALCEFNGGDEETALRNETMKEVHGAPQQSVVVNEEAIPREQENVRCQELNRGFNFSAPTVDMNVLDKGGPTFVEQWVNLVGQSSPRPRKRPRCHDATQIEDLLDQGIGPGLKENNANRDFNLNNSPSGSEMEQVNSSGNLEDGEIGPGDDEVIEEPHPSTMEEEIEGTVEFGKIIGTNLNDVRHLVEQAIRKEGINVVSG